ncbi:MAG TPA: sn-glycerol-1-phosphate dehydrogenase [Geminicoccaceae bacterium]|nr:sn-glycerol-1-phosphate dehydrogenase [Geminicoccaceae bacterium]
MADDTLIEELVAGRWRDPATGRRVRIATRTIVIERSLDGAEADLIGPLRLGRRLAVVGDRNTFDALGERVVRALGKIATVDSVVLQAPRADLATVEDLRPRVGAADALIAVGSGTLNDLCKYLAYQTGRPYAVFATAPSMNGYLTATASLARDGIKVSLPAWPPLAALFDLDVLRAAPARLIRAGIGDSLCRTTAQTDWLLGHYLRDDSYSETPYLLQIEEEPQLLSHAAAIVGGDVEGVRALTRLLVLAGLGMVLAGGSRPASMGEHLISHYIDLMARPHPGSLHGEQVGVATLSASRMQHALLQAERPPAVRPTRIDPAALRARYGAGLAEELIAQLEAKALDEAGAARMNARLVEVWPTMRARLAEVMVPTARLEQALRAAGAPTRGVELGLSAAFYRDAVRHARELRDRYSILDLAGDAGVLEAFAAEEG